MSAFDWYTNTTRDTVKLEKKNAKNMNTRELKEMKFEKKLEK